MGVALRKKIGYNRLAEERENVRNFGTSEVL